MAYFWLYDGTNTYDLDDNVINLNIGGVSRNFTIKEFAGASGGYLSGEGNYTPITITFALKHKIDADSSTAWNSTRNTLINWFTMPKSTDLYFRIRDGENTKTIETKIVPVNKSPENFNSLNITDSVIFTFRSLWGYFQNTTASTDTKTITDNTEHTLSITNSGNMETPIECNFTPTGDETLFQTYLTDSYGFRLEKTSFEAGVEIKYTTADGKLYFDDVEQRASQYLTRGSVFNIATGTFNLYILCSGAGAFDYSYYERYV